MSHNLKLRRNIMFMLCDSHVLYNVTQALQKITAGTVASQLRNILFNTNLDEEQKENQNAFQIEKPRDLIETKLTSVLNESQLNAVQNAINHHITLIQGPPGTGKTQVAAAIAEQFLKQQKRWSTMGDWENRFKILLSAYSNIAVDVLTTRMLTNNLSALRIGSDSSLSTEDSLHAPALLNTYPVYEWQHRISAADIICSTSIGSANEMLKGTYFDLILIDETTQSTESGLLVALSKLKENGHIVLIGDHKQLPPTIRSTNAKDNGLGVSLFERLVENELKPSFLDTQYRMHPRLAEFPSAYFYDNQLLSGVHAKDREIPAGFNWPREKFPIAFVQTGNDAHDEMSTLSIINNREAEIVTDIVMNLIAENDFEDDVTVISPYSAQKQLIEEMIFGESGRKTTLRSRDLRKRVKVRTVDGFQGSESDVIVFSATRCNDEMTVGFLKDYRRVNVMLTRTKKGLIVVGDRATLASGDQLWADWLKYVCDDNQAITYQYADNNVNDTLTEQCE